MKIIEFDPNIEHKRKLWVNVYSSVIDGLYRHDKWISLQNSVAKETANKALEDYKKVFEMELEDMPHEKTKQE